MGIREEREAQAVRFVSVRDLLEGLAVTESTTIDEVAGYLLQKLSNDGPPRFVRRDAQSLAYYDADVQQEEKLLRHVSYWKNFEDVFDECGDQFDTRGWFRGEMAEFIKGLGIEIPPCCSPLWRPEPKRPDWFLAYQIRDRLSINEATRLLNGIDPEISEPFDINDEGGWGELRRWCNALCDAVGSGRWDFDPSSWARDRGEQTLSHSGIKAWARDTGAPWPFLDFAKAPAPESPEGRAMARDLKEAKGRIAELEKDLCATRKAQEEAGSQLPQTRLMAHVMETYRQYWGTFDPDAPAAKRPNQSEILGWLQAKGLSISDAKAVEKVACPFDRNLANRT